MPHSPAAREVNSAAEQHCRYAAPHNAGPIDGHPGDHVCELAFVEVANAIWKLHHRARARHASVTADEPLYNAARADFPQILLLRNWEIGPPDCELFVAVLIECIYTFTLWTSPCSKV